MSVKVMTAVFERYPNGGGEMLLALALADHASDDGSKVYPSIKALAEKTRQSERTVQYQLRRMEAMGWLILVSPGHGGRSMTSEYRISSDWIKGAEIAPFQNDPKNPQKDADFAPFTDAERVQSTTEKGATDDTKGCNPRQKRVQPVAPANNHHRTIIEPSMNHNAQARPQDVPEQVWSDWSTLRKQLRAPVTETAIDGIRREAGRAGITLTEALQTCCANGWRGFKAEWLRKRGETQQSESFRERDERLARERFEALAGRAPARTTAHGMVIDVTPEPLRIAS